MTTEGTAVRPRDDDSRKGTRTKRGNADQEGMLTKRGNREQGIGTEKHNKKE